MVKKSTNMVLLFVSLDCQLLYVYVYVSNRTVLVCIFKADIIVTQLYSVCNRHSSYPFPDPFHILCGPSIPQRSTL
jgi:hypothetical protein